MHLTLPAQSLASAAERGFTVVELMVAVAVAAILTAIAAPAFNSFVQNDRDIGQVNSLVASFNYARSEAIKQHLGGAIGVTVCPSSDGLTCNNTTAWSNGWIVWNQDPALAGTKQAIVQSVPALGGSNVLTATGDDPTQVTFQYNGGTRNFQKLAITVCDSRGASTARDVEVLATGKVAASQNPGFSVSGTALTCS